jgi:hypothetical protein
VDWHRGPGGYVLRSGQCLCPARQVIYTNGFGITKFLQLLIGVKLGIFKASIIAPRRNKSAIFPNFIFYPGIIKFYALTKLRIGHDMSPVWVLANNCGLSYAICCCSLIGLRQNVQIHTTTSFADVIHDPVGIGVWI